MKIRESLIYDMLGSIGGLMAGHARQMGTRNLSLQKAKAKSSHRYDNDPRWTTNPSTGVVRKKVVTLDVSGLTDGQILGLLQLYASENIGNHGAHNGALLKRISQDPTRWPEWVDQVNAGMYKDNLTAQKFANDPEVYYFNLIQGYKISDLLDEIQKRGVNKPSLSKGSGSSDGLGQNALLYGGLGLAALLAYRRFSKKK